MIRWLSKRGGPGREPGSGGGLRPSRNVLTARRDGTAVLLDLDREVYLTLDETGAVIWEELERGSSRADICRRLVAEFDAPRDLLERDADVFLQELQSRGLVVRS